MTPVALPELPDMEVFLPIARLTGKPQVWLTQKDALEMALRAVLAERAAERARCALAVEKLRDSHVDGTRSADNPVDWCAADGIDCEFVVAWNDAIAAIRAQP